MAQSKFNLRVKWRNERKKSFVSNITKEIKIKLCKMHVSESFENHTKKTKPIFDDRL